ncbi:MAG TPA: hypothetical protein VL400_06040 [Polyangiaceae bacterium]|jgi:hypothetical protein|nr:hypothetical protein [Polyangiaceae bacterium]
MVSLESRAQKDDPKNARLSERGRTKQDEPVDLRFRELTVDFDDDLYADVPCTD